MFADHDSIDDWLLLAQAARGDDAAFRLLVERFQGRLLNFFIRAGAQEHAEDLVQETFIRLHRHRNRAQPRARFTTYLHTMAHHVWIDHVRRRGRMLRLLDKAATEADANPPYAPSAGASLDAQHLLATLSPDLRHTLVLVVYQGLTHEEAAEVLGIPTGTVKSRVFNSLHQLRRTLESSP